MVSVLASYSNNPSSNPTKAYSFYINILFEKNENRQKEAGLARLEKLSNLDTLCHPDKLVMISAQGFQTSF